MCKNYMIELDYNEIYSTFTDTAYRIEALENQVAKIDHVSACRCELCRTTKDIISYLEVEKRKLWAAMKNIQFIECECPVCG